MDQYNIEIFSCSSSSCHDALSASHQTDVEIAWNCSEDNPLISRIQSLHRLLEVDDHDEEEYSVVLTLGNRLANSLQAQHQSTFFLRWVKFLWMGWHEYVFVVSLQPLIGLQKHVHSISTQTESSNCICEVFLLVVVVLLVAQVRDKTYSSHEEFLATSENCLCLQIQFWFPLHIHLVSNQVVTSNMGPILVFPRIQPFGSHDFSTVG